jgi:16S rRNA C967 or C1407 C5-methylase (RsmB/RsmF family)
VVGPELVTVPLTEILGDRARELGDENAFTVTPHHHGTDGFYARVMRRVD